MNFFLTCVITEVGTFQPWKLARFNHGSWRVLIQRADWLALAV
jgi:hypothetical protein